MCTSPVYIINPTWVNSTKKFPCVPSDVARHPDDAYSHPTYLRCHPSNFPYKKYNSFIRAFKDKPEVLDSFQAFNPDTGECVNMFLACPCGKCDACRLSKFVNLKNRMLLEALAFRDQPPFLLTLTYRDSCLPKSGVLKSDVQKFMKRLRIWLKRKCNFSNPIRYVCFSEYGEQRQRPHYHLIIYGLDYNIFVKDGRYSHRLAPFKRAARTIEYRIWKRGICDVQPIHSIGGFTYVAKYVLKGSFVPDGKNPNFRLASNRNGGLGCSILSDKNFTEQMLRSPDGRVKIQYLGRLLEIYVPKQVYSYLFKDDIQSLRRKYLKDVNEICYFIREIQKIYNIFVRRQYTLCPEFKVMKSKYKTLKFDFDVFGHIDNVYSLFIPEVSEFPRNIGFLPQMSRSYLFTRFCFCFDMVLDRYDKLSNFNVADFAVYQRNSELKRKFSTLLQRSVESSYEHLTVDDMLLQSSISISKLSAYSSKDMQ